MFVKGLNIQNITFSMFVKGLNTCIQNITFSMFVKGLNVWNITFSMFVKGLNIRNITFSMFVSELESLYKTEYLINISTYWKIVDCYLTKVTFVIYDEQTSVHGKKLYIKQYEGQLFYLVLFEFEVLTDKERRFHIVILHFNWMTTSQGAPMKIITLLVYTFVFKPDCDKGLIIIPSFLDVSYEETWY